MGVRVAVWSLHLVFSSVCLAAGAASSNLPRHESVYDAGDDFGAGGMCALQRVAASHRGELQDSLASGDLPSAPVTCQSGEESAEFKNALAHSPYFWVNKNGDASCTGASKFAGPSDVSSGPSWSFKDSGKTVVRANPVIDDEMNIYLSHVNGRLRKFSRHGQLMWTNEGNFVTASEYAQRVPCGPLLMDGRIYTATSDGHVTSVNMSSGTTLWHQKVATASGGDAWSVMGRAGLVVVAMSSNGLAAAMAGNDQLVALSGEDGSVIWRWMVPHGSHVYNWLGSFVDSPPSVVFTTSEGVAYRVRLCDGKTLWESKEHHPGDEVSAFSTGGAIVGPNGLVYVTSNSKNATDVSETAAGVFAGPGRLAAYNVTTGALVWYRDQSMPANNAPSVGRLGLDDKLSVVVALGTNPGFPAVAGVPGGPFERRTELVAFDATTGEPTGWGWTPPPHRKSGAEGDSFPFHICLPDAWSNGAIDARGTYYVGHMSGHLFALRDADGDGAIDEGRGEVARYYGGRCYQGSPGLAPGMVVSTPCDGMHVFLDE